MQHQRDRDVEYHVIIWGIPTVVARKEDSWKVVKDVLRDMIDGQPKRGDFRDDENNGKQPVYFGQVQTEVDALQAFVVLAGRNWYDCAGGKADSSPTRMRVTSIEIGQGGWREIAGPSDVPVDSNAARTMIQSARSRIRPNTATHRRTSFTSSNVQFPLSPVAAYYGLRAPTFGSGIHPPVSMLLKSPMAARMVPPMAHRSRPDTAMALPYSSNMVDHTISEPGPSTAVQASAIPPHTDHQRPARVPIYHRQVIITNLPFEVTENQLTQLVNKRIGRVVGCSIETRGDRKCHAFVTFGQVEQANRAVHGLNGQTLFDRKITVRLTKEGESGPIIVDGSE